MENRFWRTVLGYLTSFVISLFGHYGTYNGLLMIMELEWMHACMHACMPLNSMFHECYLYICMLSRALRAHHKSTHTHTDIYISLFYGTVVEKS